MEKGRSVLMVDADVPRSSKSAMAATNVMILKSLTPCIKTSLNHYPAHGGNPLLFERR